MMEQAPMNTSKWEHSKGKPAALALALGALASFGCATPPKRTPSGLVPLPRPVTVQVRFDAKGCPSGIHVVELENCLVQRCFFTANKQQMFFQAFTEGTPPTPASDDFELQFDPFKDRPFKSASGRTPTFTIDVDKPGHQPGDRKSFQFNILSVPRTKCAPLDPEIIIVW